MAVYDHDSQSIDHNFYDDRGFSKKLHAYIKGHCQKMSSNVIEGEYEKVEDKLGLPKGSD